MITPAFLWLILSQLSVIFPVYIGYKLDFKKWKTPILVLIITAFFSSLYHWDDQDHYNEELIILGTDHFVHKYMDFYGCYLSFLMIIFYSININDKNEYFNFYLVLLNIISVLLALVNISWYLFTVLILLLILGYLILIKKVRLILLILKTLLKNKIISFIGFSLFIISMIMQYYLCNIHDSGYYYQLYHGFWHFCLYLSAGICMIINKYLINRVNEEINYKKIICFQV